MNIEKPMCNARTYKLAGVAMLVCVLCGCATNYVVKSKAKPHREFDKAKDHDIEVVGQPAYYALLPLTIPFDIATSPIQFCVLLALFDAPKANRYYGNFYGVAQTGTFEDSQGKQETGVLFYVQRAGKYKVIGHDTNNYRPLTNYSAVLITRRGRLFPPEKVPLNREIMVRGLVGTGPAKSKTGKEDLLQSGTTFNDYNPVLRVKKIYPPREESVTGPVTLERETWSGSAGHKSNNMSTANSFDVKLFSNTLEQSLASKWVAGKKGLNRVDPENKQLDQDWSVGSEKVSIHVRDDGNKSKAAETMQKAVRLFPKVQDLPRFAEEAYISKSTTSDACTLMFRKRSIFVSISASSEEIGRQFAQDVLNLLP